MNSIYSSSIPIAKVYRTRSASSIHDSTTTSHIPHPPIPESHHRIPSPPHRTHISWPSTHSLTHQIPIIPTIPSTTRLTLPSIHLNPPRDCRCKNANCPSLLRDWGSEDYACYGCRERKRRRRAVSSWARGQVCSGAVGRRGRGKRSLEGEWG